MDDQIVAMLTPEIQENIVLITLASVFSFGATEITKPFFKFRDREKAHALVRLVAVLSGALVAFTLGDEWTDFWMGACAGVLNAWVMAILKNKIETKFQVRLHKGSEDKGSDDTPESK